MSRDIAKTESAEDDAEDDDEDLLAKFMLLPLPFLTFMETIGLTYKTTPFCIALYTQNYCQAP